MKSAALVVIIAVLTITGCSQKKSEPSQNVLLESYRLIDEQRDDEAIALLEDGIKKNPQDRELRMALASAYAHYAGLKIQKFSPMLSSLENLSKVFEKTPAQKLSKTDTLIESFIYLLHQMSGILSVYSSIPELSDDKIIFIEQAITEISLIKNLNQDEAIYRAVLRVVLLRHKISSKLFDNLTNIDPSQCKVDLDGMNQNIINIGRDTLSMLDDIQIANPDKSSELVTWRRHAADAVSDLSLLFTSAMVLDEVSVITLKKSVVEEGFLKLLKCGIAR